MFSASAIQAKKNNGIDLAKPSPPFESLGTISVEEIDLVLAQASTFNNFRRPGNHGCFRNDRPIALRRRFSPGLPLSMIFIL